MPVALRLVDIGFAQGADPVLQHVARCRMDQSQRHPGLVILGRGYPVEAVIGKELGPALEFVGVEAVDVIGIELLKLQPPYHRLELHCLRTPSAAGRYARSCGPKLRSSDWLRRRGRNRPFRALNTRPRSRGSRAG